LTPVHRRLIFARQRVYFDLVRATLERLKEAGRLPPIDTTVATFGLFGALMWLPRWYSKKGRLSSE
jgi:hypothetical protein